MALKELQAWLESEQSLSSSISAIDKFIRQKLRYRYKKPCSPVSNSVRMWWRPGSNVKRGRESLRYIEARALDETSTSTDMIRRYDRALGSGRWWILHRCSLANADLYCLLARGSTDNTLEFESDYER